MHPDGPEIANARLYPPLAEAPDREQAIQLEILRRRVMEYWVDGVLGHSLYNEALISLGKQKIDKAVDAPWKYTAEVSDLTRSASLEDRGVSAIYDETGLLLILGEPGAGKTTTLIDLARRLPRWNRRQGVGPDRSEPLKLEEETAPCRMDVGRTFGKVSGANTNRSFLISA